MWENADILFLFLPNTRGTTRFTFLSLPISFSFSFTLWMVHLAYMTEWIHNPGQFKILWGPVGIKWNHISRKDCCATICRGPGFCSFPFHVVGKCALPLTQMADGSGPCRFYLVSDSWQKHDLQLLCQTSTAHWSSSHNGYLLCWWQLPVHRASGVTECLEEHDVNKIHRPSQSLVFSPASHLWGLQDYHARKLPTTFKR